MNPINDDLIRITAKRLDSIVKVNELIGGFFGTVGENFDYIAFKSGLGLINERVLTLLDPESYPYMENVLIGFNKHEPGEFDKWDPDYLMMANNLSEVLSINIKTRLSNNSEAALLKAIWYAIIELAEGGVEKLDEKDPAKALLNQKTQTLKEQVSDIELAAYGIYKGADKDPKMDLKTEKANGPVKTSKKKPK